jgi:dienelactone hydrolase
MNLYIKKGSALFLFCYLSFNLVAQKPIVDTNISNYWPSLGQATISNDGGYISYVVINSTPGKTFLVIQGINNDWKVSYEGASDCQFCQDNRRAYFQIRDTVYILTLGSDQPPRPIPIHSMRRPRAETDKWLAYEAQNKKGEVILLNLLTSKETRLDSIKDYIWEDYGRALVIASRQTDKTLLQWVDIPTMTTRQIWSSEDSLPDNFLIRSARFDCEGKQLIFVTAKQNNDHPLFSVWYYRLGADHAIKLASDQSQGIAAGLSITGNPVFSRNGRYVFLNLEKQNLDNGSPTPGAAQVDIYSYNDAVLQSQQLKNINNKPSYLAAISIAGGPVLQLEQEVDGDNRVFTDTDNATGEYIVMGEKLRTDFKSWWVTTPSSFTYFLVSLKDGTRKLFRKESKFPIYDFTFSPDGKWLVYWDSKQAGYVSYNSQNRRTLKLTSGMSQLVAKGDYVNMFSNSLFAQPVGSIKWVDNGKAFLAYGEYDIWKIDPSGIKTPLNLTAGYGFRHHIILRIVYDEDDIDGPNTLATAFDIENKKNGFYKVCLGHSANPELLTMGPYCYYRTGSQIPSPRYSLSHELYPAKAKDLDAWIISRQTASEYPNYYYTRDWKKFTPLTDLQPQKSCNWLTSELITYKQLDGSRSQGILYKPENFNPRRIYPVIFNFYEHLSYRLYEFCDPGYTAANINIPWFVSRGYLVFTPDNHYSVANAKRGKTFGETVYNSVVGAARFLSTLPYVDSKHMGIQGHSFGGGETNYLVTHSKLFAAACSVSGTVSDEISAYLGPYRPKGGFANSYRMAHAENGHEMIGATLWERPDLYFRSSSVFNANQVTSPLLLVHNEKDEQTDWGQSFELYAALRRLGMPVWLLQYDGEGHVLVKKEDQRDFTIRLTQFFDHYLKGTSAPIWMTRGIPAKLKGIDQGYELDSSGKQP